MPRTKAALAIPSPLAGESPWAIAADSCLPRYQATGPNSGQQARPRIPKTKAVTACLPAGCGGAGGRGGGGTLATLISGSLETVGVLADAGDDHALAVGGLDDQEDVEDEDDRPDHPEHAAGERNEMG